MHAVRGDVLRVHNFVAIHSKFEEKALESFVKLLQVINAAFYIDRDEKNDVRSNIYQDRSFLPAF